MPDLTALLHRELWGNTVLRWGAALGVALAGTTIALVARRILARRLRARASQRESGPAFLADGVAGTRALFLAFAALVAGAHLLALPSGVPEGLRHLLILVGIVQLGLWGNVAVRLAVSRFISRRGGAEDPAQQTGEALIGLLGRVIVWSAVALVGLANAGVDITALVAGLGVGGVAVALALQNVLSDLFASVSILLDKPFRRGDFIIVGDLLGTIERIGLKTTRIRSLWGEQLVLSNNDLLSSRIRNYKRMQERRVLFEVGVVYATPADKLELVGQIIREAIEDQEGTRFDRAHLRQFADFSLVYEAVYYVLSRDYNVYMDVNEAIHLAIFRRFEEEGLEFAFPTRTIHLQQEAAKDAA